MSSCLSAIKRARYYLERRYVDQTDHLLVQQVGRVVERPARLVEVSQLDWHLEAPDKGQRVFEWHQNVRVALKDGQVFVGYPVKLVGRRLWLAVRGNVLLVVSKVEEMRLFVIVQLQQVQRLFRAQRVDCILKQRRVLIGVQ